MAITTSPYFVYPFATAGDKATVPQTSTDGSVSYSSGWGPFYALQLGVDPSALPIPRNQMNQLFNDITQALQQYQQWGIPNYITSAQNLGTPFPYQKWAYVLFDDTSGTGPLPYQNTVTANTNVPSISGVVQPGWSLISGSDQPPGTIILFGGTTAPAGYLPLDGSISGNVVSRTTYSDLFAAIGTTWGTGDGTTTFGIPNFGRHVPMGSGGTSSSVIGNTVGSSGGEETHTLIPAEVPNLNVSVTQTAGTGEPIDAGNILCGTGPITGYQPPITGATTNGGGGPHNNVQPSNVVLYCMKF